MPVIATNDLHATLDLTAAFGNSPEHTPSSLADGGPDTSHRTRLSPEQPLDTQNRNHDMHHNQRAQGAQISAASGTMPISRTAQR